MPEENRLQKLAGYFKESAAIHKRVLPIISRCLEGMDNAGESIDPSKVRKHLHKTNECMKCIHRLYIYIYIDR